MEFLEVGLKCLIAYHLSNSFRLVNFSEMDNNKSACHIELENIGDNEEAQSILWKASKNSRGTYKKKMDLVYN